MNNMKRVILVCVFLFAGCATDRAGLTTGEEDLSSFLTGLGTSEVTLSPRSPYMTNQELRAIAWMLERVPSEVRKGTGDNYAFRCRAITLGDPKLKFFLRHAKESLGGRISSDKLLILFTFIAQGEVCPSHHGIIDPARPKVLTFWTLSS